MAIEKLSEFAKDGQKNTDHLNLTDGFPINKKPARQWFNWLFNTLTSKVNEIIDADFIPKTDIVNNLTTDDAKKPVSAKQAKNLQDNKLDKTANAASATKLNQSRKIGGVSFDATKDINLPGVNIQGNQNTSGVVLTWLDNGFSNSDMSIDPEAAWNDGGRVTAKLTNSNNALAINVSGLHNERKVMIQSGHDTPTYAYVHGELQLNPLGGTVTANGSKVITVSEGTAVSATRLQNPRTIFGQTFDGSGDVGGTVTATTGLVQADSFHYIDMGRNGLDRMSFYNYGATFNFIDSQNGNVVACITSNGIDCNSATTNKLKTPRNIALSGAVSGNANFDGSGNVEIVTSPNTNSLRVVEGNGYTITYDDARRIAIVQMTLWTNKSVASQTLYEALTSNRHQIYSLPIMLKKRISADVQLSEEGATTLYAHEAGEWLKYVMPDGYRSHDATSKLFTKFVRWSGSGDEPVSAIATVVGIF